jgi:hypothetical protein
VTRRTAREQRDDADQRVPVHLVPEAIAIP